MHTLRFSISVPEAGEAQHRLRADGGVRTVESTLRVAAEQTGGGGSAAPPADTGVVIALDFAPERIEATRRAAAAAISALPDHTAFALLQGGDAPRICYPYTEVWAAADDMHRNLARFEAERLLPADSGSGYGTVYADWLDLAREHFAREPKRIRHLLMITDGRGRDDGRLGAALDASTGVLTCDVLGVGDSWEPELLTRVATRLHGMATLAEDSDRLEARLAGIVGRLRAARVPAVPVEVRLRAGVQLVSFRESAPVRRDLSPDPEPEDVQRQVFTTHLWDAGTRDYTLTLEAGPDGDKALGREADPLDADLLLAQVAVGDEQTAVRVRWSYGVAPGAHAPAASATYHLRDQLADAFNQGCNALSRADLRTAQEKLGEAARIAHLLGDDEFLDNELSKVAEVVDAAQGLVRLREHVDAGEVLQARLSMQQDRPVYDGPAVASSVPCPAPGCDRMSTPAARFCVVCGTVLTGAS